MQPSTALPSLGVLDLIARTFRLLGANFAFLFPLGFVPALAVAALTFIAVPLPDPADPAFNPFASPGASATLLVGVVVSFVVSGVMCLAALDAALGKRHTLRQYLDQTLRFIGPIIVLGFLVSVATGLGMLFLILPGFYVLGRLLPWTPAVVFENAGWGGLARAQDLTAGYRWPLAGAALLMGLALVSIMVVLSPILIAAGASGLLSVLAEGVASGLYYALTSTFTALVYLRLREIQEGATIADIAASID